ncbi:hypothetical protein [Myxococcus landrumensis]|uniref:Uncharacterized protein n=1 Tax=Myxococcus landrumensis TaxID=2813577 RepID=A0ABX7NFK3_9BACT|nr:hypothetical protein [Myxococcus landrumus]QSQ17448.1 hypothetical protein JY572_15955 [Myxococcus landrumus]
MTAQISDSLIFRERQFALAAADGEGLFNPEQQRLSPQMISTACYRGYWCTYEVIAESLRLQQLHIGLSERAMRAAQHGEGPSLLEQRPVRSEQAHCFVYNNLAAPIPFSGGLLIAADFIQELYFHGGFQNAWKFREVHELLFEGGRQVQARDCSSEMANIRESLKDPQLGPTGFCARRKLRQQVAGFLTRQYKL